MTEKEREALEKMGADIRLRNLSESTLTNYTKCVQAFWAYCNRPVMELDENDVRRYLEYLAVEKKLAPRTVNLHCCAIRFFFAIGLNRYMNYLQMPLMKVPKTLPDLLTKEEISTLISACTNVKHKAQFLLAYGSGLRSGEIVKLLVKDIDSQKMRVFVRAGKNKRDHYTILSQSTLGTLREYWQLFRPKNPGGWLFPGTDNGHISRSAVSTAFYHYINNTNITKDVSPHSLRHAFATHMLEDGVDIMKIKEMLGHNSINSTTVYLHLVNSTKGITSPADTITSPADTMTVTPDD